VLDWANNLLDAYPQSHTIVATHAFIDPQCNYDSWALNLINIALDTHPNVFLTLNGHYHPTSGNRTESGYRYELLFNQQDAYGEMGADTVRILTFDIARGTIQVQTYQVWINQFLQDSNSNFTLTTTFGNDLAGENVPKFLAAAVLGVLVLLSTFCLFFLYRKSKMRTREGC
jgi:hypothetical protein